MAQNCQNWRKTNICVLEPASHNPRWRQIVTFYTPHLFATLTEATQLCIMTGALMTAHAQVLHR